jgi:hypothetical protein
VPEEESLGHGVLHQSVGALYIGSGREASRSIK